MSRNIIRVGAIRVCWLYLVLVMGNLSVTTSWAAEALLDFETQDQAALYLQLTKDHRCLKCQNQNLADSNASIAQDLKREIYERVIAGDSRETISNYLVSRYGDFVLYRPPFKATTYALWIGPFVLLLGALWYALRLGRKSKTGLTTADNAALSRARKLLDD